jgi:hypothetical protein
MSPNPNVAAGENWSCDWQVVGLLRELQLHLFHRRPAQISEGELDAGASTSCRAAVERGPAIG